MVAKAEAEERVASEAQSATWKSAEVRYGYLIAVAAAVFTVDQASKAVVKSTMELGETIPLIPPFLDLHYITNRGVAFGLFSAFGDVFVPVAIAIMSVIVIYYRGLVGRRLLLRTALALQLGGPWGTCWTGCATGRWWTSWTSTSTRSTSTGRCSIWRIRRSWSGWASCWCV